MMVNASEPGARMSAYVAPLQISKGRLRDSSNESTYASDESMRSSSRASSTGCQSQITPPATPNGSQEALAEQYEYHQPVFHNFLRTIYPFHPTDAVTDSSVTLPLNEGDVILVHSIHTNGWADGTLLLSGARGWLPTNYCEAYEPELMRSLLKALLHFWDLLRSGVTADDEVFGNQEFMRGIIAGVRFLLEKSSCLTRDSPRIQSHEGLRRSRKTLLSDLSSLVKTAKRLQEIRSYASAGLDDANNLLDEMVLKAFKIVTRGVRFLDVFEDSSRPRHFLAPAMATVDEEAAVPPTPPADSASFDNTTPTPSTSSRRVSIRNVATAQSQDEQTKRLSYKRASVGATTNVAKRISIPNNRHSALHRLSTTGPLSAIQRQNCVSEKLSSSHDTFLSFLGSLIGRLHLQSPSPNDLLLTIKQSISSGQHLLSLVETVCSHDSQNDNSLSLAKDVMYRRIHELIAAAKDCVGHVDNDDNLILPAEINQLKLSATDCVVAAGDCVAKTKFVLEQIGDYELNGGEGLGIDVSAFDTLDGSFIHPSAEIPTNTSEIPQEPSAKPPPPPTSETQEKPLPYIPTEECDSLDINTTLAQGPSQAEQDLSQRISVVSLLPPLPKLTSPLLSNDEFSPTDLSSSHDSDFTTRSASIAVSSGTNSTYMSSARDSESSMVSQTSTRATTPESGTFAPSHQSSLSNLSGSDSHSTLGELDDGEAKMLEKTFAHELLFNKERQITGGTLPALVERLTTHDSTPDAIFVSTFYLTFRLFATPVKFAEALVERFDYVSESPHIAGPVRLRVYNVFKGWLETHWRNQTDRPALDVIEPFSRDKLSIVLPGAGRRLSELAQKVSSAEGPLVPRLVSSVGKTNTAIAQYIPPDTPLPAPVMNKSSSNALKNWKMGGTSPTILDFDPLELARQLTIKEMNIFCAINSEELLASEWMKKSGSNAVNVRAMSTLSTDLSNLVADTILHHEDAKKRAVIIKQWIKVADKCLELNNYDSLMAIICSLNSSTITRLKKTWDMVSQKRKDVLKTLQDIVEPTKNHAVLRQRMQNHVPPCLPFVGTYLTDLTFVDIGNPVSKQLPGVSGAPGISVINFDKHTRTAKIIGELQRFQLPYRLTEVPELQEWLQAQIVRVKCSNDQNNVQQFYRKSLLLEPRVTVSQKSSPVEPQGAFGGAKEAKEREKFDLFSWTHSAKDKVVPTPIST